MGRTMKRMLGALVGATALILVLPAIAPANHVAILSFDPPSPVTEGTNVTVTFGSSGEEGSGIAGNVKLFVCQLTDGDASLTGEYAPTSSCGTDDPEAAAEPDSAAWVELASRSGGGTEGYAFDTSGLGGYTIGFMTNDPPVNASHTASRTTLDLVVEVLPVGGDGHPGCKGVENAYERVTGNPAATMEKSKGKAAEVLSRVADKLGC